MHIRDTLAGTAAIAVLAFAAAAPAVAQDAATEPATAKAALMSADGQEVGTATVTETPGGVLVALEATGMTPGAHGFHVHTTGQCDAPDFKSAGGHFNPGQTKHGVLGEGGPHAGDMPNVWAGEDGGIRADVFLADLSISAGGAALLDDDGAAFVIHAGPDDYRTDPAGDAGDRVACGIIEQ